MQPARPWPRTLFWVTLALVPLGHFAQGFIPAIAAGVAADQFLATQGDVWDTQWDMFLAGCGAVLAILTLSRVHDRAISRMTAP